VEVYLLPIYPALEGNGWSAAHSGRFPLSKESVLIVQEAEWASWPVWPAREVWPLPGFDSRTVQFVASRYTAYFPGAKRPGREIDHLHRVPKLRISGAIPLLLYAFMAWTGTTLSFHA
jgi:hypothetical protein